MERARLQRLVDDLGGSLLDVIEAPASLDIEVTGASIYDPRDGLLICAGELLLGVGVGTDEQICDLVHRMSDARAAALIVKLSDDIGNRTRAVIRECGIPLLGLTRAASWFQVAVLLQTLLDRWTVIDGHSAGDSPLGDLFAFANAVSALVDAPVTVEDRSSRVLAYSGRQDEADAGRIETVLGRQVPQSSLRVLEERGVFRELYRTLEPIDVPALSPSMQPRVAVAVRAGGEVLGSLWVAAREPLSADRRRVLAESAELAALHLLRQRHALDFRRQLSASLLEAVLGGGPNAADAAVRLGLRDGPLCVLAGQPLESEGVQFESACDRLADALALHLTATRTRSAVATIGNYVYAVVATADRVPPEEGMRRISVLADDFVARVCRREPVALGIGGHAQSVPGLGRSKVEAERAVRVLRSERRSAAVSFEDVYLDTVLDRLDDALAGDGDDVRGPVARLVAYDAESGASLTASLRAYLDHLGDVTSAARAVRVHPNTFRYRLRRIQEVSGINLDDARARLAVLVQLTSLREKTARRSAAHDHVTNVGSDSLSSVPELDGTA